jgi:hypothetical protein
MRGFMANDRWPARPLEWSDAGSSARERDEPMPEEKASDPFEDRQNGAASLGIP